MPYLRQALFTVTLALALMISTRVEAVEQSALAMYGDPAYTADFDHFNYTSPKAVKGGRLKYGAVGSFDSLNPFIILGRPALGLDTGFLSLVYEPLMVRSQDEPFTLYGLLAQTIEVPEDRSSITFHLNKRAHFSDGVPVLAEDVIFSFDILRDKGRPNHRMFYKNVAKVEKLDDWTVRFTFHSNVDGSINREMPLIMGLMPILPRHDWKDRDFDRTTLRIPIGSGPYKVKTVDPGRSIVYERDPNYWGKDLPAEKGLHNFDEIDIDYYRDTNIALEAFKAGQFDLRLESDVEKWCTAYDFPAVQEGRVRLERLEHHRTEPIMGFIFNTRRVPFDDPAFRAALEYSFDSAWINRNIFHGQYERTKSFFPNSELAAPIVPDEKEKSLLELYRSRLPADLFTNPVIPPDTDGTEASMRASLLKAGAMLKQAGYHLKDDLLLAPRTHEAVSFTVLLNNPMDEKLALVWSRALRRLGIVAHVKVVDSAQYQARLTNFDFDVTINKWVNSLSPGNEQLNFWGSIAADQKGSRNYAGIKDKVVDDLASAIPAARTRARLVTTVHALDRVLMSGHYIIPFYYLGADDVAYWRSLRHPDVLPLNGIVLEAWWMAQ